MKKHLAAILCATLLLTIFGSACERKTAIQKAPFKIGQLGHNTTGFSNAVFVNNRRAIVEAAGGELITENVDDTPQSLISGVKKLIEDGCRGIILTPTSNSILPQVKASCDEAKVYWVVSMRPILDKDMEKDLTASSFYVGDVAENDENAAYYMVRFLSANGIEKMAVFSISNLNSAAEARESGIYRAADECGVQIVEELRNVGSGRALNESVNALLALHPELDAIFSVSGMASDNMVPMLKLVAALDQPEKIKCACIDVNEDLKPYFDQGILLAAAGGQMAIDACISTALLVNAVTGHPVSEKAVNIMIPYQIAQDGQALDRICDESGTILFSNSEIQTYLLNTDRSNLSVNSYHDLVSAYNAGDYPYAGKETSKQ